MRRHVSIGAFPPVASTITCARRHLLQPSTERLALVSVAKESRTAGSASTIGNMPTTSIPGSSGGDGGDGLISTNNNSGYVMRSIKYSQLESFFFKESKTFCRLCMEEIQSSQKQHVLASSRASHTNHTCREVVLDSMSLLAMRGYKTQNALLAWATLLYRHPDIPRIPKLTDPHKSVYDRAREVNKLMVSLRDMGYITHSLAVGIESTVGSHSHEIGRRRLAFERYECIGDNTWGSNISDRMMILFPDRQWLYSLSNHSFNCFRDAVEMNVNLEVMFEFLDIISLLPPASREKVGSGKVKADIIESLLGELHHHLWSYSPSLYDADEFLEVNNDWEGGVSALIQHVLTEIFDLIVLYYCSELLITALPLSNEVASEFLWKTKNPGLTRSKDRVGANAKRKEFRRVVALPDPMTLHETPTPTPTERPHPLLAAPPIPETVAPYNGTDIFKQLIETLEVMGDVTDEVTPAVERHAAPKWADGIRKLRLPLQGPNLEEYVVLDIDPDEIYFRDNMLDLSKQKAANGGKGAESIVAAGTAAGLSENVLLDSAVFPPVTEKPTEVAKDASTEEEFTGTCAFAASRFVPAGIKPPNAGVITATNLHHGMFLFEAIAAPLAEATSATEAENSDGDGKPNVADDEAKVDDKKMKSTLPGLASGTSPMVSKLMEKYRERIAETNPYFASRPGLGATA